MNKGSTDVSEWNTILIEFELINFDSFYFSAI